MALTKVQTGMMGAGSILQVQVYSTTSLNQSVSAASYPNSSSSLYLYQVAITPLLATSNIYVSAVLNSIDNGGSGRFDFVVKRNTTSADQSGTIISGCQIASNGSNTTGVFSATMNVLDSPASTSTQYYKVCAYKQDTGTGTVMRYTGDNCVCSITVMEIAA